LILFPASVPPTEPAASQPGWTTRPEVSIRGNLPRIATTNLELRELRELEGRATPDSACLIQTGPEEIAALIVVTITRIVPSASHDTFPLLLVTQNTRTDSGMMLPLLLVTPVIRLIRRPLGLGQRAWICLEPTHEFIQNQPK
jgi:hypothetical protein